MKNKSYQVFTLYFLIISYLGCDFDKYLGYDYIDDPLIKTRNISGTITNMFTHELVPEAKIQIGLHSTKANFSGEFFIDYELIGDEDKDQPVLVRISKKQYFTYTDSIIIYPEGEEYDFELEYAAPVIENIIAKLSASGDCIDTCQAIISDYQGIQNINNDSVRVILEYNIPTERPIRVITGQMNLIRSISGKGHYQFINNNSSSELAAKQGLLLVYSIIATDFDSFTSKSKGVLPTTTNELLFPPN